MKEDILIEKIIESATLNLFKVGCDKNNFRILKSIPSNVNNLIKEFNLSKMPMNRRINELEKVGLVKRDRWKGDVEPTELTKVFLEKVEYIKKEMKKVLPDLL